MLQRIKRRIKGSVSILESRVAYRLWATDYQPSPHNPLMELEQQAMLALMPALGGQVVLDVACGTGRWGNYAQEQGAKAVVGVDHSVAMLKQGVLDNIAVSELIALPFEDNHFDVILCGLAIGHLPADRMQTAIYELGRVLKAGGVALISDLHPFQALNGAQRTFRTADGKVYAVEHYVHQYEDYHRAANAAGLRIMDVKEPNHPDLKMRKMPVVLVLRFEKRRP
jgi:malonyl-CoA O-methyltransferase